MKIEMLPTVLFDDIRTEFGFDFGDVFFTDYVESGTYVYFDLSEDAIAEREEEIDDIDAFCNPNDDYSTRRRTRYKNELTLIHYFRNLGYTDEVLIFICW